MTISTLPRIHDAVVSLANVIRFPRELRVAADYSPDAMLRKVRMSAMAAGCNQAQVREVAAHAQGLLDARMDPRRILPAAQSFARQLLTRDRAPTLEGVS